LDLIKATTISDKSNIIQRVSQLRSHPERFDKLALDIFQYQYKYNALYRKFVGDLGVIPNDIKAIEQIPFLPISAFRTHQVLNDNVSYQQIFESSGTTGGNTSKFYLDDISWYTENVTEGIIPSYGDPSSYCWLALLPSYLERGNSSLVFMVDHFIKKSNYDQSGFFLNNLDELALKLQEIQDLNIPCILIGVSFALLDFAESHAMDLSKVVVMETGGMKGRRKEMPRFELHEFLNDKLNLKSIHSEYGMTELLSQAYSKGEGIFDPSPTMKVIIKDITDPFAERPMGKSGVLNVIDLANIEQCSFIETADIGVKLGHNQFKVLGRLDHAMMRGCNLLYQE